MYPIFDSHAHYDAAAFDADREDLSIRCTCLGAYGPHRALPLRLYCGRSILQPLLPPYNGNTQKAQIPLHSMLLYHNILWIIKKTSTVLLFIHKSG